MGSGAARQGEPVYKWETRSMGIWRPHLFMPYHLTRPQQVFQNLSPSSLLRVNLSLPFPGTLSLKEKYPFIHDGSALRHPSHG